MSLAPAVSSLAYHEAIIERGLTTFVEVGEALLAIQQERLYRDGYASFDQYLAERWHMTRQRAHQLIGAAEVSAVVSTMVDTTQPATERQARELAPLIRNEFREQPEVIREVWSGIVETAERTEMPITSAAIRSAVRERVKSMAQESEEEIQKAASWMTPDQKEDHSAEAFRQRGEVTRLIRDITKLPAPDEFVVAHRAYLPAGLLAEAEAAYVWLHEFLFEWRHLSGK